MLAITRRRKERVFIDDDITIEVLAINGNQVRLGISAPLETKVHREEVYYRIQEAIANTRDNPTK